MMKIIVKTVFGLEEVLAEECREIGAFNPQIINRAVTFEGDNYLLYKCNHLLRTAIRVLVPFHDFEANNEQELYQNLYDFDWSTLFDVNQTFAIDAVCNSEIFTHSKFAALKSKDAIADFFRNKFGKRPSVDIENPDLRFNIHIFKNQVNVSLDSSGNSLHQRGYRRKGHLAPLNEVLAAGMLRLSGWNPKIPLYDSMCGTGTFSMEAAMMARNIAPGFLERTYAFMNWKDFDKQVWKKVKTEAQDAEVNTPFEIFASDISAKEIMETKDNMRQFGFSKDIRIQKKSFFDVLPEEEGGILILNPPYGERMEQRDIEGFYKEIGNHLKNNFKGFSAFIITSNVNAMKTIGLKPSSKHVLYNGSLECKFLKFEMYAGSKKAKFSRD